MSATFGRGAGLTPREPDHTPAAEVTDEDAVTMVAFARGNAEAFVTLYEKHKQRIANYCRRLLGSQALGEEAAQDVFLKLYEAAKRYRPESRFSTYLYRIATNHCLNALARHERKLVDRERDVAATIDGQAESGDAAVHALEVRRALAAALVDLPPKQGAAFLLCQREGLSLRECAAVLEVSESAVKSLVHRAREQLVRSLSKEMGSMVVETSHGV